MKAALTRLAGILVLLGVAACALPPPAPIVHQPMTARAQPPKANEGSPGAIYQTRGSYRPLFEDVRARAVGDTLTVLISEKTAANKKGASNVDRSATVAAEVGALTKVPGKSLVGLNASGSSSNAFDASGGASAANDFTGALTVTVTEVLPNGNLLVSGEKQIAMSQGAEYIRFSGVVNPRMITGSNTVASSQIADARIEYKANGYIDEAQVMGWLARFFLTFLPF